MKREDAKKLLNQLLNMRIKDKYSEALRFALEDMSSVDVPDRDIWKPEPDEYYWFFMGDGAIHHKKWEDGETLSEGHWNLGNVFKTKSEAKFERERIAIMAALERFAAEHNTEPIRLEDTDQSKWFLFFDIENDTIEISWLCRCIKPGVYFTSADIAQNAIAEIGYPRIKLFYFGVGKDKWLKEATRKNDLG